MANAEKIDKAMNAYEIALDQDEAYSKGHKFTSEEKRLLRNKVRRLRQLRRGDWKGLEGKVALITISSFVLALFFFSLI